MKKLLLPLLIALCVITGATVAYVSFLTFSEHNLILTENSNSNLSQEAYAQVKEDSLKSDYKDLEKEHFLLLFSANADNSSNNEKETKETSGWISFFISFIIK